MKHWISKHVLNEKDIFGERGSIFANKCEAEKLIQLTKCRGVVYERTFCGFTPHIKLVKTFNFVTGISKDGMNCYGVTVVLNEITEDIITAYPCYM